MLNLPVRVAKYLNLEQRERFSREVETFMNASEREQRVRLSGGLPSVEEFWEYRLGSSAVGVCLAVNEYVVPTAGAEWHLC